jgi:L-alanine-DL-glutamate epimerase-like enolase superfamily enzyme
MAERVEDPARELIYESADGTGSPSAMTIRDVAAWVIRSPHPAVDIGGGHSTRLLPDSVLVRITTESGLQGFGDSWVQQTDARILRAGILLGLRPLLLDQDAWHLPRLWDRLWRSVRNHGLHPAMSAVDIALWDLRGRAMGRPVWALLGGLLRDRVEAYATIPWNRPVEEQVQLIDAAREWGFTGVKFAIGHGVAVDKERIVQLRTQRPDMPLAVDSNGAYDVADAIAVAEACDATGVRWFEEPCPYYNVEGLAAVAARVKTPISGFQSDTTVYALRRHLSLDSLAIFQPSFDKCGGITQGVKIANVLEAFGKRLVPHSAAPPMSFLAAVHVGATAATGGLTEFMVPEREPERFGRYPFGPHLVDSSLLDVDHDGYVTVPTGPGLGVEIDMDRVRELDRRG